MEEGLKVYLDDPAMCAGDSDGGSDVDAWLFVSLENDYVLNRSGKWLQERYQKHSPIKVETDRINDRPTDQPTEQPKSRTIAWQTWQTIAW